ncbi:MAG: DHA2 family efflux MFS transporter permease subunit [Janthinobacterium lividum]
MIDRRRVVLLIVACPLFLQNLDTSIMATALPSISRSLDVPVLHLNLAITAYLLSLAVFLPASGWLADRFGTRRMFCWAIALFSLGSALCGLAQNLPELVVFRILQGMGGAMMVPVGRLILLRSTPANDMVNAMIWFTVPGVIGRLAGPLLGGLIVTLGSWRWIFLLNVPFGILGVVMSLRFVDDFRENFSERFDSMGFLLLSIGLVGMVGGFETSGKSLVPVSLTLASIVIGCVLVAAYLYLSKRHPAPIIDFKVLHHGAFRTSVIGGMPLRVAIGASPFLLPLMFQLGFGLTPLVSGSLSVATAVGSLTTRAIISRTIRTIGFRSLLISACAISGLFYFCYGLFEPSTPHLLIFVVLLVGGLCNSVGMTALNSLGYSDIPQRSMSRASALASMAQQLSLSIGVSLGAALLSLTAFMHGGSAAHLTASDFGPAFAVVGAMTWTSLFFFFKLDREVGAELRHR